MHIGVSRRGNAYDMAQAESFIRALKYEGVYLFGIRELYGGAITDREPPRRGL